MLSSVVVEQAHPSVRVRSSNRSFEAGQREGFVRGARSGNGEHGRGMQVEDWIWISISVVNDVRGSSLPDAAPRCTVQRFY